MPLSVRAHRPAPTPPLTKTDIGEDRYVPHHCPAVEVDHDVIVTPEPPIPLSHLALDLNVPSEGWALFLGKRGIAIIPDSLGRDSIGHDAARRLLDEKREAELRARALRALAEQEAVERDQQRRASLGQGVKVPDGLSYAEAVMQAELDSQTYRPRRRSLVEDLLSNDGITFHPIQHGPDEE